MHFFSIITCFIFSVAMVIMQQQKQSALLQTRKYFVSCFGYKKLFKTLLDQVIYKVPALGNFEINANLIHLEYITLATQNFICKSIINSSMLYTLSCTQHNLRTEKTDKLM